MDNLNTYHGEIYKKMEGVERGRKLGVVSTLDHDIEFGVEALTLSSTSRVGDAVNRECHF